ncbi:hypothetical protein RFI_27386, partial [Reticulomyxa filosa]
EPERHCTKCKEVIEGRAFKATNGDPYHRKCFVCDTCKKLLNGKQYAKLTKDDGTVRHFCASCTQKHNEEEMKKLEEENRQTEKQFKQMPKGGGSSQSLVNQLKAAQNANGEGSPGRVCLQCKEKIAGRGVQTPSGELYHLNCFTCDNCKCALSLFFFSLFSYVFMVVFVLASLTNRSINKIICIYKRTELNWQEKVMVCCRWKTRKKDFAVIAWTKCFLEGAVSTATLAV